MNMHYFLIKIDCTIEETILKLWENNPFHNANINNEGRNKYPILMEKGGKTMINTEQMIFDKCISF